MTDLIAATAAPCAPSATELVDEFDGKLTCTSITDVTHDVKTFTFKLPGSRKLRFLPGQYLTLTLDIEGIAVERCYTISTAPTHEELAITVKRVPGGTVSNWLHDHLCTGDTVGVSAPFGEFSYRLHSADKYLFLTAGSGITPAMSMLRTLRNSGDPADIAFIHCARTPADIIFRFELEELAPQVGVTVSIVCEDDSRDERWAGPRGRLSPAALLSTAPDLLDREIFTCGPPPFMHAVRDMLGLLGTQPARYHEESFTLGGEPQASADVTVAVTHHVVFQRSSRTVECDSATTILEAASRAGVPLPSSCGEGVCGTCKLQKLTGDVDMRHAGGIRPREVMQDKILACCSAPISDIVVDA